MTHHSPSFRSVPARFTRDLLSAAYSSHLDDLVERSGAAIWVHGHTAVRDMQTHNGPHGEMDFVAEKLRDEAWHYRDLRMRITDESVQEALAQLIAEKEEQLRQIEEEPMVDR